MPANTFERVAELASQLSPEEQLRLVAEIGERLRHVLEGTELRRGSVDAILRAVREPPHLAAADLDDLEHAIAAGRLPARQQGVFDRGSD